MTESGAGGSGPGRARIVRLDGAGADATPAPVARLDAQHLPGPARLGPERPDPERPAPVDLAELVATAGEVAPVASLAARDRYGGAARPATSGGREPAAVSSPETAVPSRAEPPDDGGAGATAPIASFEVGRAVTRESGPVADLRGGRSSALAGGATAAGRAGGRAGRARGGAADVPGAGPGRRGDGGVADREGDRPARRTAPDGRSRRTEPGRGRARADPDGRLDAPTEFAEPAAPASPDRGRPRAGRRPPGQIDPGADPVSAAREICLALLTDRARTRQELAQALRRKGVPDDAASTVLERFDEVGLIDDAAFAGQWVRSRHRSRGLARRAIAMELRRKGVDDDVAGEALAEVDTESEERRARALVDRRLRSLTVDTTEQRATAARRLVGMLARKGYGGGIAYRVVREALAAHGADPDELGAEPADD